MFVYTQLAHVIVTTPLTHSLSLSFAHPPAEMSGEKLAADLVSEIHVHMASIQPQIEAVAKQVS